VFAAVLRTGAGFGKIGVGIFEHFILIAVAQLALEVWLAVLGGMTDFFFYRSLVDIAVRVLLFWHRALKDEGFGSSVVRKKLRGRIISGPEPSWL
jgi:hypothetical protein